MAKLKLEKIPLLPLANYNELVLPENSRQIQIEDAKAAQVIAKADKFGEKVMLVARSQADQDDITYGETIGCLAEIMQSFELANGQYKVILTGQHRCRIKEVRNEPDADLLVCTYEILQNVDYPDHNTEVAMRRMLFRQLRKLAKHTSDFITLESMRSAEAIKDFSNFLDYLALAVAGKDDAEFCQLFLEEIRVSERSQMLVEYLARMIERGKTERQIRRRVKQQMEKTHNEFHLSEHAKAIQEELEGEGSEIDEMRSKVEAAGMSKTAKAKCLADLDRMANSAPMSPESSVLRTYVETLIGLPWKKRTELNFDLHKAQEILDEDHYGLSKIKDRIHEYLAVQRRIGKPKGSVLCFVGPPGVGKTSLGLSIARATGREFVRVSLGGVHEEAAIRGHRKTYVASMPGRILKAMAKAKVRNPVFMLDEFDKLVSGSGFHGDPAAALLEVLDPEQNVRFVDQYVEVEFDLSEVMFIATANWVSHLPEALYDRLEIIRLPGYTDKEKLEIAKKHLIPKQLREHGLETKDVRFSDNILSEIIRDYTHEPGVRNLERSLAKICRKLVTEQAVAKVKSTKPATVTMSRLKNLLEVPAYYSTFRVPGRNKVGYANGMIYGHGVCPMEAVTFASCKSSVELTGITKGVKEISALAKVSMSLLQERHRALGLPADFAEKKQVHVHFQNQAQHPYGALGMSLFALLASVFTNTPIKAATALLGEINLRGDVISSEYYSEYKATVMDAQRNKIKQIIMPYDDTRLLAELPDELKRDIEFVLVRNVSEVLRSVLVHSPAQAKSSKVSALAIKKSVTSEKGTTVAKAH